MKKEKTSKHKGVSWYKDRSVWRASLWYAGKSIHVGYFSSEESAAHAYNRKLKELNEA